MHGNRVTVKVIVTDMCKKIDDKKEDLSREEASVKSSRWSLRD